MYHFNFQKVVLLVYLAAYPCAQMDTSQPRQTNLTQNQ